MIVLAVFGFFHGHAHGVEMPEGSIAWQYFGGVVIGVAIAVGLGNLASMLLSNEKEQLFLRIVGGFMMGAGVVLLIG